MAPQPTITDEEFRAEARAARARDARLRRKYPHGQSVRYSARSRQLVLTLTNGVRLGIPVALIPGLGEASTAELAAVEVLPGGLGVSWERLDVDVGVHALVLLAVGPRVAARAGGAVAGARTSPAKAAAARRNGRKGGRPKGSGRSAG